MGLNIVNLDAKTLGEADFSAINAYGEYKSYELTKPSDTLIRCKDADIILTNKVVLNKEILSNLERLKLICITATGMNIVDVEYAKSRGIVVKNVAGYSTLSVAQHTLSMALYLLGQIGYYDNYAKSGQWSNSDIFTHLSIGRDDLDKKKWGIIGFGSIGKRVAMLANAFGADIYYASTSGKNNDSSYPRLSIDELLRESDIISIHAPLNEATQNLIDTNRLRLLKKGAILINVGRGGIVNEENLADMLRGGADFYYGCDVLEVEPMRKNHPFLDKTLQQRLFITPHIAFAYKHSLKRLIALTIENVRTFIEQKH